MDEQIKRNINAEKILNESLSSSDITSKFIIASIRGDFNYIQDILLNNKSFNPNILDSENMSALHWCCVYDEVKILKLLLNDKRINPNCKGNRDTTPLHKAALSGSLGVLNELLKDKRININSINQWGETPLFLAAHNGDFKVCFLLLKNGADKTIKDNWNALPQDVANNYGFPTLGKMIEEYNDSCDDNFLKKYMKNHPLKKELIQSNTSNIKDSNKKIILSKIMEAPLKDDDFYSWLEQDNIDINGADLYKWTALHKLSAWNKAECLEKLLLHPNLTNILPNGQNGDTPFHSAIDMNAEKSLEILLSNYKCVLGINIPNNNGNTPLHNAVMLGNDNMIELLLKNKANATIRRINDNLSPWNIAKTLPEPYKTKICNIIWKYINSIHNKNDKKDDNIINKNINKTKEPNLPKHYGKEERIINDLNMNKYQDLQKQLTNK